jgi:endonuclease/exonuclease/phosphatase family metal-dependent hydrolase
MTLKTGGRERECVCVQREREREREREKYRGVQEREIVCVQELKRVQEKGQEREKHTPHRKGESESSRGSVRVHEFKRETLRENVQL